MYYVTFTNKFMSGWGRAKGKINKLIFPCATIEEAETVKENAENLDHIRIRICGNKPHYYPAKNYYVQTNTKNDYPAHYVRGYFAKKKGD